jgi:hypothetical protein
MFKWIVYHLYELHIFVVGWCLSTALYCLLAGDYLLAAVNAGLAVLNAKMAEAKK